MGGYDPTLDNLQSFCSLLEGTNSLLEVALTGLHDDRVKLVELEPDLREALTGLETEGEGLHKETEAGEAETVAALGRLAATAHQVLETRLPAVDGLVEDFEKHCGQATDEGVASMQSRFEALAREGFDVLESTLDKEKEAVGEWIEGGNEAWEKLNDGIASSSDAVATVTSDITSDLTAVEQATKGLHDQLSGWLGSYIERMAGAVTQGLEKRAADAAGGMVDWMDERKESLRAEGQAAHGMVEVTVSDAVPVLEEAGTQTAAVLEASGPLLQEADVEMEQVLADTKDWAVQAGAIGDLRPQVEAADTEVTEIRALMQVLDQP